MDNKVGSQMNILNDSFDFLRSKMFRLLRKITGNSINASIILKLHNLLGATIVITRLGRQNNLATPKD
jgi:hypothetical protein